ncbi:TonB-dependent receptor [Neptunitalea lumnitzerae]|nr:TonB-dependent receptor [Neptunitalea sp. Y10]
MKYLLLTIVFTVVSQLTHAQNAILISGKIIDETNQTPVENATIIYKNSYAVSNSNGTFELRIQPKDSVQLHISHISFKTKHITVNTNATISNLTIKLTPKNNALSAVEISVNGKNNQQIAPLISTNVNEAFLQENRENSLMQTLSKIPGVSTITIGSGQSKPVIRGLGFNRVSVVENGIKHEAQQWGADHGLEIDQYGIENINIIKGPASLLYGSDAIAGVVAITPPNAPLPHTFKGEVNLLGESNNNLLGISSGIQFRNENWYYRGRVTFRDYADYKVPTDRVQYDSYIFELDNNNLRNTAGTEANAAFSFGYIGDRFKTETFLTNVNAKNGFFANAHGLEVRTSTIDYDASNRDVDLPYHTVNHFKILNNTSFYLKKHTIHTETGFQNNLREEHSEPVPHGYMPKPTHSTERIFNKNTYSFNIRDVYKPNKNHKIVAGINTEYQNNNIGGWGYLIPAYTRFSAGAFGYYLFKLTEKIQLQAGLRYDYGYYNTQAYSDWFPSTVSNNNGTTSYIYQQRATGENVSYNNISGSLGVSYQGKNTTYKLHLGKSFRMPLANELASDGVNYHMYRYERGNLDLSPEESYQIDIEATYKKNKLEIGISPFVNYFNNFIYLNPTPNYYETLQIYEYTQSKVLRYGGEVFAGYEISNAWSANASLEYVQSIQKSGPKEGFTLPFSPPLSSFFSLAFKAPKEIWLFNNVQITADLRVTAKQTEIVPPEETTPGYELVNLSILGNLKLFNSKKQTQLRVKVNNLFNTKYFNHTSFYRLIDVPEPGRNISASVTIPM